MPVSSVTEHWIKPDAVTINLNHFGDPDYLQVFVLAGAVVMAFKQDVIAYNAAHDYRTWPLQAANTYLETTSAYNVYARLTRSEVNASALIVYDPILRDIEGRPISHSEDGSELLGEEDLTYFYVFLGRISGSINSNGEKTDRFWLETIRFGTLDSSEQKNNFGSLWEKLFKPHYDDPFNPDKLSWIEAKANMGIRGGLTMFVRDGDIDIPTTAAGLPFDNRTIWFNPTTGLIEVIGGTGGGVADSVAWGNILSKPSWITDTAPIIGISGVDVSLGGSITQSALRTALGLGSNAYSSTAYLPLTGGTLSDNTETPLTLKGTYSENVLLHLHNKSNIATSIGKYGTYTFLANYANGNGTGELEIHDDGRLTYATGGNNYSIWHEGNDGSGSGLDADLLDGKHNGELTALYVKSQNVTTDDFSTYLNTYGNQGLSVLNNVSGSDVGDISSISAALNIGSMSNRLGRFIFARHDQSDGLYWQSANSAYNAWGTKRKVAFVDSNVASATKLQTARTIWGQGFNGTNNVSGDIYFKNNNIIRFEDTNGESVSVVHFRGDNQLWIGRGIANLGYSSYLYGNSISFGYGTAGSIGMILNSSGNITIGSSDLAGTSAKLYVDGRILIPNNSSISVKDTNNGVVSAVYMAPSNNLHFGYGTNEKSYSTYINGNDIHLRYGTSQTTGMLMNSSGNVSIGASDLASTNYKLYVDGLTKITSSTNIGLQIDSSYKGEVTRGIQVLNPSMPFGDSNGVVLLFGQSTSAYNCGNIAYRHHGENNTNNYVSLGLYGKDNILVCKANGNVGIDSLNPTAKLHVNGNILSTGRISINPSGSTYDRVRIVASSNGYAYIQASNTDGSEKNGGSLYITGIDTDPLASFEVIASTSKFHGNILSTGGITMYSARKLKTIQDERGLSLEELSIIKPTRFTWKDGRDSKIHIGGIADDVMKVLPEVIYKTGEDDTLTMDYGNAAFAISASLIKPVISHEEEIKALKNRIKELEEQVKTLSWNIA